MVEAVVASVLIKLADHTISVFKQIEGVGVQIEKIRRELSRIHAFLKDADRKTIRDETQKNWVREVREVAYDIEDLIDNALLLDVEVPQKTTSKTKTFLRMLKKPQKIPAVHKLSEQINKIIVRIDEISNNRIKYGIKDLGEGSGGDFKLPLKPVMLPEIDDPTIVGFDTHKDDILKLLLAENTQRRSVVSIVGVGGLGKTTLARKVYNSAEVKKNFSLRIWVTVSQKFELIDLLEKILKHINPNIWREQGGDIESLLTQIHKSLGEKKYLLVLDDVWEEELWSHMEEALVDANIGSRILITSRNENVAKIADPSLEPYKPPVLSEEKALQLLLNKARYDLNLTTDSRDLIDVAKKLARKCGGLPLALAVLGGQLSKKPREYTAWDKLLQTMSWHTDGSQCTKILATSYDDLPLALKFCFMYFAAYPEDYEINAGDLTRLWIAEGFIPQEQNKTLEDTAERYFEDLMQRSMVEVSKVEYESHNHITKYYRVHDLLHDLAIQKAKEDNFLTVCSNPGENRSCNEARRVALHHSDIDGFVKHASSNLRSLLCFQPSQLPICSGHKLLKVLRVECSGGGGWRDDIKITGDEKIEVLSQLRYLKLGDFDTMCNRDIFCKWIKGMKFLETLDVESSSSYIRYQFPWEFAETLRYIKLPSFLGPPPGADLRNLKTLCPIHTSESWEITALPNMPNLCSLYLVRTEECAWEVVVAFLRTLKSLVNLNLGATSMPVDAIDMRDFPFYQHLKCLVMPYVNLRKGEVDAVMFPTHLTELELHYDVIEEDPMPLVEKLLYLESLMLYVNKAKDVKQMRCSAGGFFRLRTLRFNVYVPINLEKWEIEEGAMPIIKDMYIDNVILEQVPLGLKHLTKLNKLSWEFTREDESATTQAEEIRNLCRHVPQLQITIPEKHTF